MNRRDFLKSGTGVFAIAAAGRAIGANAPSNRIRLAIVGCHEKGRGAQVMQRALEVPGVEIAYVCDVDSRARDFAADKIRQLAGYTPKKEKDLRKVLEDPLLDGIISETPDHWHALSAVLAMRAGKHVYVEKPCAFCPREGEIILDTWKKTGMVFQMGSQRRSCIAFRKAIEDIRSQDLIGTPRWGKCWYMTRRNPIGRGKPVQVPEWLDWDIWQGPAPRRAYQDNIVHYNWHWFREWGTGECGNNSVHFVDIARWCLGADYPERVVSGGGRFFHSGDDWAWPDSQHVAYEFPNGQYLTWEGTSCVNAKPYMGISTGAMVYGLKGAAFFEPGGTVDLFDAKGNKIRTWSRDGRSDAPKQANTDDRSGGGWKDTTKDHLQNFVDCIRAKTPQAAVANADIGVKSTYLALVGNISQLTGEALKIDPANGRPVGSKAAEALWSREYAKGWELV